jgi:hypothetical protein
VATDDGTVPGGSGRRSPFSTLNAWQALPGDGGCGTACNILHDH